jgi:hypothetical protein
MSLEWEGGVGVLSVCGLKLGVRCSGAGVD